MSWQGREEASAAFGAELSKPDKVERRGIATGVHHGMVRREDKTQLRLLPLHLAIEGFLSLQFGGPEIAWRDYSRSVRTFGLGHRSLEDSILGDEIPELVDALRLFEIHDNQVGVLVFVSDSLFNAFVVSHPDDYRLLHQSLVEDLFGELIVYHARFGYAGNLDLDLALDGIDDLASLARASGDVRVRWEEQAKSLGAGLIDRPVRSESVYRLGPFQLQRFATDLDPHRESHIGEAITRKSGRIGYLKTYRLSKVQTRRAALLRLLADHDWDLTSAAAAQGDTKDELIRRIGNQGFGYLLNPEVLFQATKRRKTGRG